jgi:hypothetical protein
VRSERLAPEQASSASNGKLISNQRVSNQFRRQEPSPVFAIFAFFRRYSGFCLSFASLREFLVCHLGFVHLSCVSPWLFGQLRGGAPTYSGRLCARLRALRRFASGNNDGPFKVMASQDEKQRPKLRLLQAELQRLELTYLAGFCRSGVSTRNGKYSTLRSSRGSFD